MENLKIKLNTSSIQSHKLLILKEEDKKNKKPVILGITEEPKLYNIGKIILMGKSVNETVECNINDNIVYNTASSVELLTINNRPYELINDYQIIICFQE